MTDNIQVCIRMRRKMIREENSQNFWMVENANKITEIGPNHRPFVFDRVFSESDSTELVYSEVIAPVIQKAMEGINGTIFTYGQMGSGKTYTMFGADDRNCRGIIPMSIEQIYSEMEMVTNRAFLLKVSYIEIYNDRVTDLLSLEDRNLDLFEDENGEIQITNCIKEIANSPAVAMKFMNKGEAKRRSVATSRTMPWREIHTKSIRNQNPIFRTYNHNSAYKHVRRQLYNMA